MFTREAKVLGSAKRPFFGSFFRTGVFAALVCVPVIAAISPSVLAQAPPPPSLFKDLQVLKKEITKAELKDLMKAQSKALGVDCDHCHKEPDMSADTNKKQIAREMMQMVNDLNKKYPGLMKKVTCNTCHRGKPEPEPAPKPAAGKK